MNLLVLFDPQHFLSFERNVGPYYLIKPCFFNTLAFGFCRINYTAHSEISEVMILSTAEDYQFVDRKSARGKDDYLLLISTQISL